MKEIATPSTTKYILEKYFDILAYAEVIVNSGFAICT